MSKIAAIVLVSMGSWNLWNLAVVNINLLYVILILCVVIVSVVVVFARSHNNSLSGNVKDWVVFVSALILTLSVGIVLSNKLLLLG